MDSSPGSDLLQLHGMLSYSTFNMCCQRDVGEKSAAVGLLLKNKEIVNEASNISSLKEEPKLLRYEGGVSLALHDRQRLLAVLTARRQQTAQQRRQTQSSRY